MPENGQQQAGSRPGLLGVQNSHNSSCVFKPISSSGKLESLGLTPVPKVRVRPTSMKKKKPSALDKQYRHVALLQQHNRRSAAQQAQQRAQQQRQQQELAGFSQQLRANNLAGDTDALQQTWPPAAAAAALQEHRAAAQQQTQQLQSSNPKLQQGCNESPHLRKSQSPAQHCSIAAALVAIQRSSCSPSSAADATARRSSSSKPAVAATQREQGVEDAGDDDVDCFLDGLLQQAAAQKAGDSSSSKGAAAAQKQLASSSRPSTAGSTAAAAAAAAAGKQHQKGSNKAKPAWALSEQQQAEAAAATAADEAAAERELLQFAEGLSWEQVVGQLDDEQLAAAFQELDFAEQQASAGDASADQQWRRCFVTALNHAVMQGVSAAAGCAAASEHDSEHDRHSVASSASQARRAEATAGRRQKLLDRLARISSRAGSTCNGGSRFGGDQRGAGGLGTGVNPGGDNWDGSTRVGGDDVAVLTSALKALEAGEVLAENPEMRGMHSLASVRTMLLKAEAQK